MGNMLVKQGKEVGRPIGSGRTYSGTSLAELNALIAGLSANDFANSSLGIEGRLFFPRDDAATNSYRRYQWLLLLPSNTGVQYYVDTYDHLSSKLTRGEKDTNGAISSSDITSSITAWNLYVS